MARTRWAAEPEQEGSEDISASYNAKSNHELTGVVDPHDEALEDDVEGGGVHGRTGTAAAATPEPRGGVQDGDKGVGG